MIAELITGAIVGCAYLMVKRDPLDIKDVNDINAILEECNLKNSRDGVAKVYRYAKYKTYNEYYVSIPLGKSIYDLEKCIAPIETYFKNIASVEATKNEVFIKVYSTHLKEFYPYRSYKVDKSKGLNIVLGMSRDGVIECNLNTTPHLSIVGSTGGGKSVMVNSILCNLIENYSDDELELVLLDLKGNELNEYQNLKHTKFHTTDVEQTETYFKTLQLEMVERYQRLGSHRTIQSYNKANPSNRMKYQFIVVEECYSLIGNKEAWKKLSDILSKARACGMHIMLTTQRPASDVIPSYVTTHLGVRVGLKTNKAQESINAIETKGLERLTAPGSGIINFSGKYEHFQGFYISDDEITRIMQRYTRQKEQQGTTTEEKVEKLSQLKLSKIDDVMQVVDKYKGREQNTITKDNTKNKSHSLLFDIEGE